MKKKHKKDVLKKEYKRLSRLYWEIRPKYKNPHTKESGELLRLLETKYFMWWINWTKRSPKRFRKSHDKIFRAQCKAMLRKNLQTTSYEEYSYPHRNKPYYW